MPKEVKKKEPKKTAHYVDNVRFTNELIEYLKQCKQAEAKGLPEPAIPNYIGECFLKIATNLARSPNFINYSFKDEMIMDGVENCLLYFRNFTPKKSKNAFSYFTTTIWYAFIRRIEREKKESYMKYKLTQQNMILEELEDDSDGRPQPELYENIAEYIQNFEDKAEEKKEKRRKHRLSKTMPDSNKQQ